MEKGTLVLTRSDIQNALSLAEYLPVIEEAHALQHKGRCMRRIYYMRMSGTGNFI